ncbi:Thiol-disulfide isomerase and thioredoxins [Hahella chejuensis KCTC 2396]|uniref:Thiol-disulfide isomerase and thioredoxins n=1 Tax=Hahella chejuensis (strain KCTC 2396) TaxID=349521 RepID=Q2SGD4_HAHCH|nr:redoxin domain-containing protein [Hahella chejuensis]ABC30290.1 Thiol-disulfide isomerase and thioredoxins [Hahella chejuensis KCTC 2396]
MKVRLLLQALSALTLAASVWTQAAPKIDVQAPGFSAIDSNGEVVNLSDYKGKYVVLEWTNHECPYVGKHYGSGNMQGLQSKYRAEDVVWLTIISSAPGTQGYVKADEANALTASRNAKPTHVVLDPDGAVGKMYDAKTTPHMYIIDPEGVLRYAGAIDSIRSANKADIAKAVNYLDKGMQSLFEGMPVDPKATPPYGCTVKYES